MVTLNNLVVIISWVTVFVFIVTVIVLGFMFQPGSSEEASYDENVVVLSKEVNPREAMTISKVLVACDDSRYFSYWPVVEKAWQKVGVEPLFVFVGSEWPSGYPRSEREVLFPCPTGLSSRFVAQCIRLLYPALLSDETVLISDMDMIPMSRDYFFKNLEGCFRHQWVCYTDVLREYDMIPICYNLAHQQTYQEVFQIYSKGDIVTRLKEWAIVSGENWFTDQRQLFELLVHGWPGYASRFVSLKNTGFNRFDKSFVCDQSPSMDFSDSHLPPFEDCPEKITQLLEFIRT